MARNSSFADLYSGDSFELTAESLTKFTQKVEPSWTRLPIRNAESVVEFLWLMDGFSTGSTRKGLGPVASQIEDLRNLATKRLSKIQLGEHHFVKADLSQVDAAETSLRTKRLQQFLDWLGDTDSAAVAQLDFGESGSFGQREASWTQKSRIMVPNLAFWRPPQGDIPISPRATFVRLLHALLVGSGEPEGPSQCTLQAVFQFLRRNKQLLEIA
jgi:hypothetical protein